MPSALPLLTATLIGLAVGVEREWSGHTTGPDARFAGLRTFTLLGALGGFAGYLWQNGLMVISLCIISGAILMPVVAYATTMRRPGTTADGTTEVAALLVATLGLVAGLGQDTLASGAGAVMVFLLAEKSALHRALQTIDAAELRATLLFAVMALVVLPLLPSGQYGPFGAIVPRQLWTVVLLFSALNFAGYIARRIVGESRGLGLTGLLGGLLSSTAVALTFSRRSRQDLALARPLALGVIAACTILLPRITLIAGTIQPALLPELVPVVAPTFLAACLVLLLAWSRADAGASTSTATTGATTTGATTATDTSGPMDPGTSPLAALEPARQITDAINPLALGSALQMALAFQVVLLAIAWLHAHVGDPGVLTSAALLGLTDMDALTFAMARLAGDASQVHVAALAIGIGILANTLLKVLLLALIGTRSFRMHAALALGVMGAASVVALWWRW